MTSLLFHIIGFIIPLWPFNFQFFFFSLLNSSTINKLEKKQNSWFFFLVFFVGKPTLGTLSQAYLYLKIEQICSCYMRPDYGPGRLDYHIKTLTVCIWLFFFPLYLLPLPGHFSRLFLKVITILHIITILLGWIFKCYMFAIVKIFRAGFGKLFSKGSEAF